jgi:hypothetical protein
MFLFDIAEAVDLERARTLCGATGGDPGPAQFRTPTPPYAGFENPPVVGTLAGEGNMGVWKLFEYGVLCIESEIPFEGPWPDFVSQSQRFQESLPDAISKAEVRARELSERLRPALEGPYEKWQNEDYVVLHMDGIAGRDGSRLPAEDVIAQFGGLIAQLVRGEPSPLAARERDEVLSGRLSCYDSDLRGRVHL